MIFILGFNHTRVKVYGPVKQEQCGRCNHSDIWQLTKISQYFTLFFIPIFPHDSDTIYQCPACGYRHLLDKETIQRYKAIVKLNTACMQEKITEEEYFSKLEGLLTKVERRP